MKGSNLEQSLNQRGITRREFLKFCTVVAGTLALDSALGPRIARALEASKRTPVIWLELQDCAGCTESFLRASRPPVAEIVLDILSVDYQGEMISTRVAIGPDDTTEISLVGKAVFQSQGDVFDTLIRLRDAMKAADRDEINELIGELEVNHAGIRQSLGRLGGRQDQLDFLRTAFTAAQQQNVELTSDLWDADIAQLSVQYNSLITRLQVVPYDYIGWKYISNIVCRLHASLTLQNITNFLG